MRYTIRTGKDRICLPKLLKVTHIPHHSASLTATLKSNILASNIIHAQQCHVLSPVMMIDTVHYALPLNLVSCVVFFFSEFPF